MKTLSDPNRIRILRILVRGEFCVSDLVAQLQVDQPKVSHHLAILRSAGIIRCRRDGRHINYSLFPAVHQRKSVAAGGQGAVDEFNLGDISVSFSFTAEAEEAGAPATTSAPRIRLNDMQVAASPAAVGPAPVSGSAATGANASASATTTA